MKTVMGLMDTYQDAEGLVQDLVKNGFSREDIGLIDNEQDLKAVGGKKKGGFMQSLKELFGAEENIPERDREYLYEGIRRGGVLVAVDTDDKDAEKAADIMDRHGVVDLEQRAAHWKSSGWKKFDEKARPYTQEEAEKEKKVYPVIEEEIRVGKRAVEKGRIRIFKRVSERPVEEKVTLREEHAKVERRPVDRPVSAADEGAFREESFEVHETAEEPVISKEARVKEEVVVGKESTERTETIRDTVRRTDVEVAGEEFDQYFKSISAKDAEYDDYREAYLYTHNLLQDRRYKDKNWSDVEADVHVDWEKQHPGTWMKYKDTLKRGWVSH